MCISPDYPVSRTHSIQPKQPSLKVLLWWSILAFTGTSGEGSCSTTRKYSLQELVWCTHHLHQAIWWTGLQNSCLGITYGIISPGQSSLQHQIIRWVELWFFLAMPLLLKIVWCSHHTNTELSDVTLLTISAMCHLENHLVITTLCSSKHPVHIECFLSWDNHMLHWDHFT